MIPPALTARLVILGVSTLTGTVIPFLIKDKPVLKWSLENFGPTVISRVEERIDDRFNPEK